MTDETQGMPPLPETGGYRDVDGDWVQHGHTDDAMLAYGRKCIEECVERMLQWYPRSNTAAWAAEDIQSNFGLKVGGAARRAG